MFTINGSMIKIKMRSIFMCCTFFLICSNSVSQTTTDPMRVDVFYPQQLESNQKIVLSGTVEAKQFAELGPLESGRVETVSFEIGDRVSTGQLLLTLDNQLAKLEVIGAKAEVESAKINVQESERLYQEAQRLSEQKVVPKTLIAERAALVSSAKAQLARANATLNLQKERLNRHSFKAPFDGVIAQRNVDVGEWVTQQTTVLTLVGQSDLRLSVAIPQQYYQQLYTASDVTVSVMPDSDENQKFNAQLNRLVPVSNNTTRTFLAQIDIPNDVGLVPGMSAQALINVPNSNQSKITLPRSAIKKHPDGGSSLFIVEDSKAKRVLTNFTLMPNDEIAIYNQPTNQAYIISGVEFLRDGTPVKVNIIDKSKKAQ
ncbi:MAG: efflux RND transporter periplasmic adaptor subunit [Marinicellaceae bacterium]